MDQAGVQDGGVRSLVPGMGVITTRTILQSPLPPYDVAALEAEWVEPAKG